MDILMIAVVDCEDSYVNNLVAMIRAAGEEVSVIPEKDISSLDYMEPDALVLSPGPGHPSPDRGSWIAFERFVGRIPILGVCLGHQTIVCASGGQVLCRTEPTHGRVVSIEHDGRGLFRNAPDHFSAVRYNSLIADSDNIGKDLTINAIDEYGDVMAVSDIRRKIFGVQFHPESFMTESGELMIRNFIEAIP